MEHKQPWEAPGEAQQRYGKLLVVGEPEKRFYGPTRYNVYVTVQCECGSPAFEVALRHLKKRKNMNCGCERKLSAPRSDAHGKVGTGAYLSWASMKARCLNPEDNSYPEYGGAGITVCERWLDFKAFYEDMGDRPEGMTLNRVHGSKVYCKDACEWATLDVQAFDQKMKSHNTSGKTGVYWSKRKGRWLARIWKNGKTYSGGFHRTFESAVAARVKLEEEHYGFTKD
jgi:hypothetical protein